MHATSRRDLRTEGVQTIRYAEVIAFHHELFPFSHALLLRQSLFNRVGQYRIFRRHIGCKALQDGAITADEKLLEVPQNIAHLCRTAALADHTLIKLAAFRFYSLRTCRG